MNLVLIQIQLDSLIKRATSLVAEQKRKRYNVIFGASTQISEITLCMKRCSHIVQVSKGRRFLIGTKCKTIDMGNIMANFVSWFYRISLLFTVYFLDLYSNKTFTNISKKSRYYFILVLAFQISSTLLSCNIFYNKKLSKKRRIIYVHFRNEN
jgi:hypothetical protein